jgi:predicted dehydrogenase
MIKLAIIGTGGMAKGHAATFKNMKGVRVVAACDVDRPKAEAFAESYGIPAVYGDVDTMLAEAEIDAVSNVTSDAWHAPLSLKAIAAGKHVLCEKPLATNYPDAKAMADAARRKGVINMVNFSYRNSSAIQKAHQLIAAGELGRIVHFEASYLQSWLTSHAWGDWSASPNLLWRLSTKHGSLGVLGDIGVHIVDFATFPAGDVKSVQCRLKTFSEIKGKRLGDYALDANDSAVMTVELKNGAIGTIHTTRWATGHTNSLRLRIYGEKGGLEIDLDTAYDKLRICRGADLHKAQWKEVLCGKTPNIYQRFITSIKTGKNDQPDFARGATVQKVLDACLESDRTNGPVKV